MKWSQSYSGPWLFWSSRNLGPEKFGPPEVWSLRNIGPEKIGPFTKIITDLSCEAKLLWDQICRGPNILWPKVLGTQISWGPKKSGDQMRLGTISVTSSFKARSRFDFLRWAFKPPTVNLSLISVAINWINSQYFLLGKYTLVWQASSDFLRLGLDQKMFYTTEAFTVKPNNFNSNT